MLGEWGCDTIVVDPTLERLQLTIVKNKLGYKPSNYSYIGSIYIYIYIYTYPHAPNIEYRPKTAGLVLDLFMSVPPMGGI